MRVLFRLSMYLVFVALAVGCHGKRGLVYHPLYFQQSDGADTADFYHDYLPGQPFSVELLGKSDSVGDSTYVVFLQIGVYGSPQLDLTLLKLEPDSVSVTANGFSPISSHSVLGSGQRPWVANSGHWFVFDRDSIATRMDGSSSISIRVDLEDYAVYDSRVVDIESIDVVDPWSSQSAGAEL